MVLPWHIPLETTMQYEKCIVCVHKKIKYNNIDLKKIFLKSLESINTKKLIQSAVKFEDERLKICDRYYNYETIRNNCYLVGFGKAVFNMALEIESILGTNLIEGICSIPTGMLSSETNQEMAKSSKIKFFEGAKDNLPDSDAEQTAIKITKLLQKVQKGDLLIVLISGGGSALLPAPVHPLTIEEKFDIIKALSRNGADIFELNCVRKKLSLLKGGGLARFAYPADVCSLILSDVIGDPLDVIASGPTLPNHDPPKKAIRIIKKYGLIENISEEATAILKSPHDCDCEIPRTPLNTYIHCENYIIGNNKIAAEAAKADAIRRGYQACILSLTVSGEVQRLSKHYADIACEICEVIKGSSTKEYLGIKLDLWKDVINTNQEAIDELLSLDFNTTPGLCIILAGEPTIRVHGKVPCKGGRNQHLALQFSVDIRHELRNEYVKWMNVSLLCCGTDGIDGPTDAAGAIGDSTLCDIADTYDSTIENELDPFRFLRTFDSNGFYEKFEGGNYLIKTGHTGTNVMDLHILMINKSYYYAPETADKASTITII